MSDRKTLTLRPVPFVSPEKIKRTEELGLRFVDRKGRYLLQKLHVVRYEARRGVHDGVTYVEDVVAESTWVDIPLVPEVYA
jgi:S1-C subfamily serine protease